jgi:hypothetical protein
MGSRQAHFGFFRVRYLLLLSERVSICSVNVNKRIVSKMNELDKSSYKQIFEGIL